MNTLALGPSWLDPDYLLNTFGLPGLLLIVFAESGLLIGFFLPGDSLLFTTGLLVTTGDLKYPLWLVCTLVALAAIVGDQVGYLFGRKVGPSLFKRPDSRLFKQENVEKAHEFFEKYGPKSLVLARFVPIVRTFTPIIAGVSRMNYRSFITFNIIGGVLWGVGVTLLGSALGKIDFVHEHIELILILIVLVSVVPIVIEFLRARSRSKKEASVAASAQEDEGPSGEDPFEGVQGLSTGDGSEAGRYGQAPYGTGQADPYDAGRAGPYGTGQATPYNGAQGGPYATGQPAPYGSDPYGDGRQDPYGDHRPGAYGDAQYGAGPYTDGGQAPYGNAPQGAYGQPQQGPYGEAPQAPYGNAPQGAYGQQPPQGPYGNGRYGEAPQAPYGNGQGQYGNGAQAAPYGGPAPYGNGQAAPYDGGYGAAGHDGRPEDDPEGDPGQYGWQTRR
ncbi:VTT domain-containing protein [Streptomyces sp. NRRL WC-3549]|uniref:VTT domain-containing protein n=1 Tax=Streptomyces sp. NRRL WC-3549 TaxID=1463925 RepID=UPI0004C931C9|nr:VTT domain-containing protein [Streptomyces sp. NRRL WC-3549]